MTNHTATKLVVVGPNLMTPDGITFHVHGEGCADLKKAHYRPHLRWTVAREYASVQAIVEEAFSDIIAGDDDYSAPGGWKLLLSEFKFFACVKDLPQDNG